ncbi:hypothetical protein TIFTF001_028605 [Ficus carica]|uniref:Uncharacterized protein n=1 Tax=Ficus carica TaxID=3494 RepID=A0AA88DQA0_FICCA|nr:hypothetical protein TIFTF001_028605 [Ficus carica]
MNEDQNVEPIICDTYAKQINWREFYDWKRNLLIVLNIEKHSFVFTLPQPPTPAIDAPDREFVALERRDNSNLSAMCYIRASMSNVLQKQHEVHETARRIMDNLEEIFGEQTIQAKTDAIRGLINCKQKASYNLNQKEISLTELMKELQAFENIFKDSGSKAEANVVTTQNFDELVISLDIKENLSLNHVCQHEAHDLI